MEKRPQQSNRYIAGAWKGLAILGPFLAILGFALGFDHDKARGQNPTNAKTRSPKSGRSRARKQNPPGVPIPNKAEPKKADDPLANPAKGLGKDDALPGKFHYTFKLRSFDEATSLAASYFPPNPAGSSAPVVLIVHEFGRSRKDFEDSIADLKGQGLAEHLQGLGFAVLSMDLRGQGQNVRRALTANDRELMVQDLQAAYQFLVDRNNRGELNLSKFGVLGEGEGANIVAAWAFQPGAAMTIDERPSDINAMILISPLATGHGYRLESLMDSLATRFPILLMAGEKDKSSGEAAKNARQALTRSRLNKVELYPSALHGYTLLRLEPKVTGEIIRFLETSLKNRAVEYEPRYNLNPVFYFDVRTQKNSKRKEDAEKAKDLPKEPEKAKDAGQ